MKKIKRNFSFILCFALLFTLLSVGKMSEVWAFESNGTETYADYLDQEFHYEIRLNEARDLLTRLGYDPYGSSEIVVAVVDTGVDITHPYLANNIWVNQEELEGIPGVDDDGNGVIDDIHGAFFSTPSFNDPFYFTDETILDITDYVGHGTHVAGIILNIVPNVKIMPVKASSTLYSIGKCIEYALNSGADIINVSYGGYIPYSYEPLGYEFLQSVVIRAREEGVPIFGAAANDGVPTNGTVKANGERFQTKHLPSAFPDVMEVMASDGDYLASWSNWNYEVDPGELVIAAPGVNILSTLPYSKSTSYFGKAEGTSMATPIVSGLAAIIKTMYPAADANFIYDQIMNAPGTEIRYFNGVDGRKYKKVDAYNIVSTMRPTKVNFYTLPRTYYDGHMEDYAVAGYYVEFGTIYNFNYNNKTLYFSTIDCTWDILPIPSAGPHRLLAVYFGYYGFCFETTNGQLVYPGYWRYNVQLTNLSVSLYDGDWAKIVTEYEPAPTQTPDPTHYTYVLKKNMVGLIGYEYSNMEDTFVYLELVPSSFDQYNKSITFSSITGYITIRNSYYNYPYAEFHVQFGSQLLDFVATEGYRDYYASYPNTWFVWGTRYNITVHFTDEMWNQLTDFVPVS